jgi:hypothetical protein
LANSGATDYVAELIPVGMVTETLSENGIGFSFATDHPEGFDECDLQLIEAVHIQAYHRRVTTGSTRFPLSR